MIKQTYEPKVGGLGIYFDFGDGSGNNTLGKNFIPERDAIRIKHNLETNEKVLTVSPDYIKR